MPESLLTISGAKVAIVPEAPKLVFSNRFRCPGEPAATRISPMTTGQRQRGMNRARARRGFNARNRRRTCLEISLAKCFRIDDGTCRSLPKVDNATRTNAG